ncbi:hypothetical protein L7F22_040527 [Adiantum nelumboides]|nr:hypothetical protein [Adiantum nelumboides]
MADRPDDVTEEVSSSQGQHTHEVGESSRPPQTYDDIFRTQLVIAVTMFTQVMQNPRFLAFMQPPIPFQQVGSLDHIQKLVKAQAQEHVAETPIFQAIPVQPATFQQPIVGSNGQGSNLQAMQQVFPPPSVHPGYFGGGSVFQSMAGHAPGNQFYTPGAVFGGFQFDYVFDWTILKYQQSQITSTPQRFIGTAGPSNGIVPTAVPDLSPGLDSHQLPRNSDAADGSARRLLGGFNNGGVRVSSDAPKLKSPLVDGITVNNLGPSDTELGRPSIFTRGATSSKRAVITSSRQGPLNESADPSRMLKSKVAPIGLRSSAQRTSMIGPSDPKRMAPKRNPSVRSSHDDALKGFQFLSMDVENRQ